MKKLFFLGFVIASVWSCSVDDSVNQGFSFEILPIESVTIPDEMNFGEVYTINYTYFKPSSCYFFHDLYYIAENNIRTVAVINKVLEGSENVICESLIDVLQERSFDFVVNQNGGTYVFKFWQGEDENGEDVYLVHEVTIMQ
jgi:hypothetical protein